MTMAKSQAYIELLVSFCCTVLWSYDVKRKLLKLLTFSNNHSTTLQLRIQCCAVMGWNRNWSFEFTTIVRQYDVMKVDVLGLSTLFLPISILIDTWKGLELITSDALNFVINTVLYYYCVYYTLFNASDLKRLWEKSDITAFSFIHSLKIP